MRIEVYAICYNEEVLLPFFLEHYSQFCDKIVVYDNYSTDRSREILEAHPLVEMKNFFTGDQIRDDAYLNIKNNCWKGSTADWVIVCDIDEFVVNISTSLKLTLNCHTVIKPVWIEMVGDKLPEPGIPITKQIRHGIPQPIASKCIMFNPNAVKEINYAPGAHDIKPVGDIRIGITGQLAILHYKNIEKQYVVDRHLMFGKRLSDMNKQNRWGVQYEYTAEQTAQGWQNLWDNKQLVI